MSSVIESSKETACFSEPGELTDAQGFTYWDAGSHRGQMGLGCPGATERRVFLSGPGAYNPDFAKEIWKAYAATFKK